ncbi:MAG: MFS transporter [Thermoanaerobaculia bacterium]
MSEIPNRKALFAGACAAMFVFGVVLAILGALFGLQEMRERLGVNLAQQGTIFLTLFFGILVSTIIAGPLIDSFGNKLVLVSSSALVAFALAIFASAHSFQGALAAAALLGFGAGGLNTSANALVAVIYPENRGSMLNILGTFFGFGALFIPFLAATLTGRFSSGQLLLIGAAVSAVCGLAYIAMPFPAPRDSSGYSLLASFKAVRIPGVLMFGILLFFESGNESAIGGWTSSYIVSLGAKPRTATAVLALYWLALMLGRVAAAKLLDFISKQRLVLASAIGSVIGCATLVYANSVLTLGVAAAIIGFSFAAIYPTTLAIVADRYERLAGTIFGLLFAIGLSGGMVFPFGVGAIAQKYGLRSGMILPVIGALAICALAVLVGRSAGAPVSPAARR